MLNNWTTGFAGSAVNTTLELLFMLVTLAMTLLKNQLLLVY